MTEHELRELGHELPWDRPEPSRRAAVRAALVLAAEEMPPRRSHRGLAIAVAAFAAGAVAAAAIALIVVRAGRAPLRASAARITASPAAEIEHRIAPTATGSDEIVRVRAGTVRIAVPAVPSTDRVRLETRDAVVEGVGEYEVAVAHDQLTRVDVQTGAARITIAGHGPPVFLAAGETWRATVITAELSTAVPGGDAEPQPVDRAERGSAPEVGPPIAAHPIAAHPEPPAASAAPPPADRRAAPGVRPGAPARRDDHRGRAVPAANTGLPPRPTGPSAVDPPSLRPAGSSADPAALAATDRPSTATAARVASSTERHFQAGWSLLRAGKPGEAAIELGIAADAGDRDPLAADARYFQAVALIRAGAAREAETALLAFLDRAPTSLRRGRAAVMLARLIAARGDTSSARAWFESALRDADPEVTAAARTGLDALRPDLRR